MESLVACLLKRGFGFLTSMFYIVWFWNTWRNNPVCVCPNTLNPLCFGVASCCFRLFSLLTNLTAVCLEEEKDPHFQAPGCCDVLVLTWPNKLEPKH